VARVRALPAGARSLTESLLREPPRGSGSAAPPHSSGLAASRFLGRSSRAIVDGLVVLGGYAGRLEQRLSAALRGPMLALGGAVRAAERAGERMVTPSRAVGAVALAAAIALGASQFVDYRGIEIGGDLYEGLESIAPAPQADRAVTGSAHAYLLLPVAVAAIGALAFTLRGRWQLGRAVALLGAIGVGVSLLIDLPKGLDEGSAALGFEGAQARLVEGFWVQLSASAVLVACGLLLAVYVRAERATRTTGGARAGRRTRRARRERPAGPAAGARA
jgi:hypothetical protein